MTLSCARAAGATSTFPFCLYYHRLPLLIGKLRNSRTPFQQRQSHSRLIILTETVRVRACVRARVCVWPWPCRCVICVNDHGQAKNLLINILPNGKFQFAGKDLDSLNDVVYMLRQRPIEGNSGKIMLNAPPQGLAQVLEAQQGLSAFAQKRGSLAETWPPAVLLSSRALVTHAFLVIVMKAALLLLLESICTLACLFVFYLCFGQHDTALPLQLYDLVPLDTHTVCLCVPFAAHGCLCAPVPVCACLQD